MFGVKTIIICQTVVQAGLMFAESCCYVAEMITNMQQKTKLLPIEHYTPGPNLLPLKLTNLKHSESDQLVDWAMHKKMNKENSPFVPWSKI